MVSERTVTFELLVVAVRSTSGPVITRVGGTRVQLSLTGLPVVGRFTDAAEVVHQVDAGAAVLAWVGGAVVLVDLAVGPGVAAGTDALVGAPAVVACSTVLTGIGIALIDLLSTCGTSPSRRTVTYVS